MNSRQKELLRMLLVHKGRALQIKDLSVELDCAEKTVRNDLDRLEEFLIDYVSASLSRKPGIGILIEISDEERQNILHTLHTNEPKTMEERLFEMAFQLLTSQKAITLQYWADRYYVPKATIKKDVETIMNWLKRFDLELVSKQRIGHVIQGLELKKRNALAHLPELNPAFSNDKNVVLDLFLPYEIAAVKKALKELQANYEIAFTDAALESLLVHALIMVKRTRQNSPVFVPMSEKEAVVKRKEYEYANWLFHQLESTFRITFPEEEKVYFTWHLISGKRMEGDTEKVFRPEKKDAEILSTLVHKMGKLTLFPFENDPILMKGLAVHMHSVINRIKYGFPITNSLLNDIKRMYPYMFSMVILTLEEINQNFAMEIPEDEAAYIVLHFQASIERLERKREVEKKQALIVCHMGIGMSHLLEAKIEQQYQEIDIVACVGKAEIDAYVKEHPVDLIISTIPLEKTKIETIVISPLFGQEDKKRLSQFVEQIQRNSTELHGQQSFAPFLMEDLVFWDVEKEHRYEVVEMLAMALYEKGYVLEEFIHSAVNRERTSATAIGGGIAIPHGDPSLITQPVLAVAIMKKPLEWGNEWVSLVFMLAMTKENQGELRGTIGKIASLSESPLVVNELMEARDYQGFIRILDRDNNV
jgi:activator of the mannose operon, transcriptional antiterminator